MRMSLSTKLPYGTQGALTEPISLIVVSALAATLSVLIGSLPGRYLRVTGIMEAASSYANMHHSNVKHGLAVTASGLFFISGVVAKVQAPATSLVARDAYGDQIGSEDEGGEASCKSTIGEYNLGIHIGALFALLVASGLGVFFPVTLGGTKTLSKRVGGVFFALRHFGTGVILATAFVHLLQDTFETWNNECLGELSYEPTAPAIMMASLLVIFVIDFIGARHIHQIRETEAADSNESIEDDTLQKDETEPLGNELGCHQNLDTGLPMDGADKRAHWEVDLLEAGICFHSVLIGVTLGAQSDDSFVPTLCALVFHQLFEGLGLGARIANLKYHGGDAWKKSLMCLAYTIITPLGIAIGIGVRHNLNLSAKSTILAIGVLDSISTGILLYASIAQLLVGDWLAGDMKKAPLLKVFLGGFAVFLGIFAMALIGKFV